MQLHYFLVTKLWDGWSASGSHTSCQHCPREVMDKMLRHWLCGRHGSNYTSLIEWDVMDQLLRHWLSVTSWNQMLRHWLSVTSWSHWHIMQNNEWIDQKDQMSPIECFVMYCDVIEKMWRHGANLTWWIKREVTVYVAKVVHSCPGSKRIAGSM